MFNPYFLALILAYLFISCKSNLDTKQSKNESTLEKMGKVIDSLYQSSIQPREPGAGVLIAYDREKLISRGYGLRDVARNLPITEKTNFRLASVSKQFTALCILVLLDQGKLALDDPVQKYLAYPVFKGMTIEQLLNHTSGLPDYYDHFVQYWDRENILENREVLEWLEINPPLVFQPGTDWEYSNTAYLMAALIVETISGMEFSKFAKKFVFEPAGMKNTNYFNLASPVEIPERAFCYELDSLGRFQQVDGYFMNGVLGDGAVYTSLLDYYIYDRALRDSTMPSPKTFELVFKPSSKKLDQNKPYYYAMGWNVTDSTASHTGGWFGTNTYVKRYLHKPLTIAIFMNRNTLFNSELIEQTDSIANYYTGLLK